MAVDEGQNSSFALTRLTAARYFFLVGKRIRTFRISVDLLLAFAVLIAPASSPNLAMVSIVWLAVSRLGLTQWEDRCRQRGAFVQWEFERVVLRIRTVAELYSGPSREEIMSASGRMLRIVVKRARRWPRIGVPPEAAGDPLVVFRDWFPMDAVSPVEVLESQRASAEFAGAMARRWAIMCGFGGVSLLAALTLLAVNGRLTVTAFIVSLLLPCAPIGVALGEELVSSVSSNQLRSVVVASAALAPSFSMSGVESVIASNAIMALMWRSRAHGVPDTIYWVMRNQSEERMRSAANG